jgi:hypothetical protein
MFKSGGASGATRFNFASAESRRYAPEAFYTGLTVPGVRPLRPIKFPDGVEILDMQLEGSLDRILTSTLPHEVTHAVLAHGVGRPLPRWADEGAATLAEDPADQQTYERVCRRFLNLRRTLPLRKLFDVRDFNEVSDFMMYHAQGHSVTQFLVGRNDRPTFLAFIKQGMKDGWDAALMSHYGVESVEALEAEWLVHMKVARDPGDTPSGELRWPEGAAPITTQAVIDAGGRLFIRIPFSVLTPETRYRSKSDGPWRPVNLGEVPAYDTEGRRIAEAKLRERLKTKTAVLMAIDGQKVDPFHLQLIKPGTIVLVPPESVWLPPSPPANAPVQPPPLPAPVPKSGADVPPPVPPLGPVPVRLDSGFRPEDREQLFSFWLGFFQ